VDTLHTVGRPRRRWAIPHAGHSPNTPRPSRPHRADSCTRRLAPARAWPTRERLHAHAHARRRRRRRCRLRRRQNSRPRRPAQTSQRRTPAIGVHPYQSATAVAPARARPRGHPALVRAGQRLTCLQLKSRESPDMSPIRGRTNAASARLRLRLGPGHDHARLPRLARVRHRVDAPTRPATTNRRRACLTARSTALSDRTRRPTQPGPATTAATHAAPALGLLRRHRTWGKPDCTNTARPGPPPAKVQAQPDALRGSTQSLNHHPAIHSRFSNPPIPTPVRSLSPVSAAGPSTTPRERQATPTQHAHAHDPPWLRHERTLRARSQRSLRDPRRVPQPRPTRTRMRRLSPASAAGPLPATPDRAPADGSTPPGPSAQDTSRPHAHPCAQARHDHRRWWHARVMPLPTNKPPSHGQGYHASGAHRCTDAPLQPRCFT
jgi:hypothetical protein